MKTAYERLKLKHVTSKIQVGVSDGQLLQDCRRLGSNRCVLYAVERFTESRKACSERFKVIAKIREILIARKPCQNASVIGESSINGCKDRKRICCGCYLPRIDILRFFGEIVKSFAYSINTSCKAGKRRIACEKAEQALMIAKPPLKRAQLPK